MKNKNFSQKKMAITIIHVVAVICLVLSLCGITYAVDSAGGSVFTLFQEADVPETEESLPEGNGETGDTGGESESGTEPVSEETAESETASTEAEEHISASDENFREEFYGQIQEAIEYTWYVHAFENSDGEIDLNKTVVNGVNANDESVSYSIQDLIHFTERYGTYDTGQKDAAGDSFAESYWNDLIGVNWCAFDLTFDLEYNPGAPVAYENRLVGITNVFNQQIARYSQLKEKYEGKNTGLFFRISYHIGDNPYPVVVDNLADDIDFTRMDVYFILQMPDSEVETNLSGYDTGMSYYDLPEITGTAQQYKISSQPVYTIEAGWAESEGTLEAAAAAAQTQSESESAAQAESEAADRESSEAAARESSEAAARAESESAVQAALESSAAESESASIAALEALAAAREEREPDPAQLAFYRGVFTGCLVVFLVSAVASAVTLVWLAFRTGRAVNARGEEVTVLSGMDLWYTEAALAAVAVLLLFWNWLPVIHTEDGLFPVSRAISWLGNYFILLTGGLSLIRRVRAGKLWEPALLPVAGKKAGQMLQEFSENQKPVTRTAVAFLCWTAANVLLAALLWYGGSHFRETEENRYLYLIMIGAVLLIVLYALVLGGLLIKAVQRQKILNGVDSISAGRLESKIDLTKMTGEEKRLADSINHIGDGLLSAVGTATKSERMKTELITNVSHDIKTPLTSIINYVDLLKREDIQNQKAAGYIRILDQKSQRLKNLIEDLVEASKVSSGNVVLELEKIDFCQLVKQIDGEFQARFDEARLHMVTTIPDKHIYIEADGRRVWRILENLYQNALKYAMRDSRVYIAVVQIQDQVSFVMKNISASPLNFDAQELTERFIRGDVARATEGSGLGLSIAKSLTELHNGEFQVYLDGDLFKVSVTFRVEE